VPALPAAEATATPLVVLSAVALALGAAGLMLFRRRNLA
jgi:ABC-2 type transport system permease protein